MPIKQKFAGLNDDQVLRLFEQIASTSGIMAEMCRMSADRFGNSDSSTTFQALETMLCGIGALADMPTGGAVGGGFPDWMLGPLFRGADEKAESGP